MRRAALPLVLAAVLTAPGAAWAVEGSATPTVGIASPSAAASPSPSATPASRPVVVRTAKAPRTAVTEPAAVVVESVPSALPSAVAGTTQVLPATRDVSSGSRPWSDVALASVLAALSLGLLFEGSRRLLGES